MRKEEMFSVLLNETELCKENCSGYTMVACNLLDHFEKHKNKNKNKSCVSLKTLATIPGSADCQFLHFTTHTDKHK